MTKFSKKARSTSLRVNRHGQDIMDLKIRIRELESQVLYLKRIVNR